MVDSHCAVVPSATPGVGATGVDRVDTIVVGAGQAGLATGYHLAARDLGFVIVDGASRLGDAWRGRWDSLRLFTPAAFSGLPGLRFPASPGQLPAKDDVAEYLARSAERFRLPVCVNTRVDTLGWDGARYVVRAGNRRFEVDVVVAERARAVRVVPAHSAESRWLCHVGQM